MRSNIKFRISLRVETPGESREMLRRSDAAFLPSDIPGAAICRLGNDEIELWQVAYTGDKVADPNRGRRLPSSGRIAAIVTTPAAIRSRRCCTNTL